VGNPFASQSTSDSIPCPWDASAWVQVRKLTGREIETAQEAHRDNLAGGNVRSWAATFRRALEKGASDPEVLKAIADPLTGYDRFALLAGVVTWSYQDKPIVVAGDSVQQAAARVVRQKYLDDLDDEAVDFMATEVLRRTKPALFLTTEEDVETAQKELPAAAPPA